MATEIEVLVLRKIEELLETHDSPADTNLDVTEGELFVSAQVEHDGPYVEFVVRVEVL